MAVTVFRDLAPVQDPWRELASDVGGPIEQYEWVASCTTLPDWRGQVWVATVQERDDLSALCPFAVKRVRGVRRRVMLGVDFHQEPMDLLARDADALETLAEGLARDAVPVEFGRLPADSPAIPALTRAFGRRWVVVTRRLPNSPYITLDASWAEPETHLNARRRSDLRRARRRAERLGEVTTEILRPEPHELDALLDEALEVEMRSWKREAGTAILCDPTEEAFIREYAAAACPQGVLRLAFLRIDGRAVAMQVAMVAGGGYWLLKVGYDDGYAACSPGILLLRDSIAAAVRDGLRSFEFLGRSEPWIGAWTERERHTVALHAYPRAPVGAAALAADAAAMGARQARRRAVALAPRVRSGAKGAVRRAVEPVSRRYVAGAELDDALAARRTLAGRGLGATLGLWDGPDDTPRAVADGYLAAIDGLGEDAPGDYVSIKFTALGLSSDLLGEIVARGAGRDRRVHLDAMAPDTVAATRDAVERVLRERPEGAVGFTLPGRFLRSPGDAEWARTRGLPVRVVKGEWTDPDAPDRDPKAGYLEVVDRLCGATSHVAVATHDPQLAEAALGRLVAAGTPCGLELLYGLPMRRPLEVARELGVPARVYVPYGHAYMPYALSQLHRRPRMALWLAKDLGASLLRRRGG